MAKTFFDLGDYAKAKEKYEELLKYDTSGDRIKVPDNKLISFEKLKEAVKGVDFPDVTMMRKGRQRLDGIKTAMSGGELELKEDDGSITKVPIPKDYDKAAVLIAKFLDEYKNYDQVEGKAGEARKGLEAMKEELEFRLKMLRASNEITTCYVFLGKQAQEEKRADDAKKAFQEALKNAENALKLWPKDATLLYNKGFCLLASGEPGNLEDAVKILGELRRGTRYGGELWWTATKSYVQALIDLGKHEDARAIIVQILLSTKEETIKFNWPEIKDVATGLAEKVFPGTTGQAALTKLLGDKVPMPDFDYTPKSELEKEVGRQIFSMNVDKKNGRISEADAKFKEELLKELVQLSKDKPAMLRAAKEPPDSLMFMILNNKVRSLKNLGGVSRGEENDKFQPELKAEPKKEPEKPAEKGAALGISPGLSLVPALSVEGLA